MDCSSCIFMEGIPCSGGPYNYMCQTGCSADRLDVLKKRGKAKLKDGYYHLTQFCNMYRNEKWLETVSSGVDDPAEIFKIAKDETRPSFGVVVQDDTNLPQKELEKTVMSFCSVNYDFDKVKVVISSDASREASSIVQLVHKAQENIKKTEYVSHLHDLKPLREKESFQKVVDYNYFVYAKAGTVVDQDMFEKIDTSLNSKLEQISMYKNQQVTCCPSKTARSMYLNHNDYDVMILELERMSKGQGMYKDIV